MNFFIKAIKNFSLEEEVSYVNAVLQSLSFLDCIKYWINSLKNNNNIMNNMQASLTKEFFMLLSDLYFGKIVDSTNIIFHFRNKSQQIYNKTIKKDAFHFLHYLLELLHLENNCAFNPNFNTQIYENQIYQNKNNDNMVYKLFCNYYKQTTNSTISQYFYNIEKYQINCQICRQTIYFYSYKKIFRFEIDKYRMFRDEACPNRKGYNLSLNECFLCYQGGKQCQCTICGNPNATDMRKIFTSTQVIIIDLNRNNHTFKCDVDFDLYIDLLEGNYIIPHSQESMFNTKYKLKAVVSLYYNGMPKYFADICINNNWYRYMDVKNNNDVKILRNNFELKEYEPQLLIYELEKTQQSFINPFYNRVNNANNNMFSMQQLFLMQMKQIQMNKLRQIMQQNLMLQSVINNPNNNPNNNNNNGNLMLEFVVIPENWNPTNKDEMIIKPQVKLEDTIKKAIDNFYIKLVKPREAIKEFKFNGNVIDINSQVKLKDFGINSKSKIYAIKAPNFDQLILMNP
jgi:hypothetical protein